MAQPVPPNPAAVINVPAGYNIQQVLNDHDHAKRSTDIPLFYGQQGLDTIAAHLLIVRIGDAGAITGWDDNRKLLEFKMCPRDKDISWFKGLEEDGIDTSGKTSKPNFLKAKTQPKLLVPTLQISTKSWDKMINDYTYRVQMAYKHLSDNKPATMATVRAANCAVAEAKAEGIADTFKFVKHQLFLAGLKDGIRDKVRGFFQRPVL
jgi:hypothetical protein